MKLALVDDHSLLTQALKAMFERENRISEVRTYNNAAAFLNELPVFLPDIAFISILMPEMNGIQLLEHCRKIECAAKFIVLTGYTDMHILKQAMERGASAFLSKRSSFEELMEAISYTMRGRQYISSDLKDLLLHSIVMDESEINIRLTGREKDVLQKMCGGFSLKQTAESLGLSINTIQYYYKHLMKKLRVKKTADLVVVAIQLGLYIPGSSQEE